MNHILGNGFGLRQLPSNIQAEQALLGAIFANNKAYRLVSSIVEPHHFADAVHRKIFETCARMIENGELADAVTLKNKFTEDGILHDVGGTDYLVSLLTAMVGIVNAPDYAKSIGDAWLRRELIDLGENLVNGAYHPDPDSPTEDLIEAVSSRLTALAANGRVSEMGTNVLDAVDAAIAEGEAVYRGESVASVSTGIPSVDRLILRLRRGNLYIAGGRPGMGKTAMLRTVAINVALGLGVTSDGEIIDDPDRGMAVSIHSLEENDTEFGAAALAQLTKIPINDILNGHYLDNTALAEKVVKARRRYAVCKDNLDIHSVPEQSLRDIASKARAFKRKKGDKFILLGVDYLQLMKKPPGVKELRIAIAENTQGLKNLSKELDVAVFLLSQINRGVEGRTDKRPTMADLNESGGIETAPDVIMFPYREAYYFGQMKPKFDGKESRSAFKARLAEWQAQYAELASEAELIAAKVRRGSSNTSTPLGFHETAVRFEEPGHV